MSAYKRKIGLALSGGGYRAAAFHLGTLRALNKMGLLDKIDVISSVSGGSIIAAFYALHKEKPFEEFERGFRKSLRSTVLYGAIFNLILVLLVPFFLSVWLSPWILLTYIIIFLTGYTIVPSSYWNAKAYDRIFFHKKRLKDLPETPVIGINSTNLETGRLFTFSKQDVGGYDYKKDLRSIIDGTNIPISFAVSASTCVPMFFSPLKIKRGIFINNEYKETLLVDGGLYDNQGAYILTESTNELYRTHDVIISDAGNSVISSKNVRNILCLLNLSMEVLMNRIRTMQQRKNIYGIRYNPNKLDDYNGLPNFAYLSLRWDNPNSMIERFVNNIKSCHIPYEVLVAHGFSIEDVNSWIKDGNLEAKARLTARFKKSIGWSELISRCPSKEIYKTAHGVTTNLTSLSNKKIDALSSYAEWLTELQVRSYLPQLLKA